MPCHAIISRTLPCLNGPCLVSLLPFHPLPLKQKNLVRMASWFESVVMCPDGQTTLALWTLPRACHSPRKRCGNPREIATQSIVVMSRDAGDVGSVEKEITGISGKGSSVPVMRKGKQTLYIKAHLSILSELSLSERKLLPRYHSHHTLFLTFQRGPTPWTGN
ncbi:hypothetical protein JMJ77_0012222 [Colletotrichum scovillei]|uniref:Uncharacterized protein n=1 Tax=Colletotrichum scovillei TaxID=1209932 RepID=A0A9P7QRX7_9PEZI|nr:hypothetical protein JMJ78_0001275 [Colletotrichum scovillei]KAG7041704.1 hypothetical protein JMJ77_0012222 [Colletotrichum scovillei]KAG7061730.1 hypothetical protein JMJ76_0003689 [Colletotrichum scovillei]